MMNNNNLYGSYRTRTFTEIFPSYAIFEQAYEELPTTFQVLTNTNLETLFYLLYSRYGNSHITSSDENQFKFRLFSIVLTDGVGWQANLTTQAKLKELTEEEILKGNDSIFNHSFNPGDGATGGTNSNIELTTINDQNVTKNKKSLISGYVDWASNFVDFTTPFLRQFKPLFLAIVNPELPLWYISEDD